MWKRLDTSDAVVPAAETSEPEASPSPRHAHIGESLSIKGELYGEEDLFIEGEIEGNITVKTASVTVGEKGRVRADIMATSIHVAGEVKGDLGGSEQVVVLETGCVEGNIKAGNVTLRNGARFKGSIDMDSADSATTSRASEAPSERTRLEPGGDDPVSVG